MRPSAADEDASHCSRWPSHWGN